MIFNTGIMTSYHKELKTWEEASISSSHHEVEGEFERHQLLLHERIYTCSPRNLTTVSCLIDASDDKSTRVLLNKGSTPSPASSQASTQKYMVRKLRAVKNEDPSHPGDSEEAQAQKQAKAACRAKSREDMVMAFEALYCTCMGSLEF
jgi:hypothetical protein